MNERGIPESLEDAILALDLMCKDREGEREAVKTVIEESIKEQLSLGPDDRVVACGSYFVCEPPVKDTDLDFLVYSINPLKPEYFGFIEETEHSESSGSRPTWGDSNPDHRFSSWRRGSVNLIVTESKIFADRHECATNVCRKLNLLKKEDRIMVYKAVLYGEFKND